MDIYNYAFDTSKIRYEDLVKEPLEGDGSSWSKVVTTSKLYDNGTDGWELTVH